MKYPVALFTAVMLAIGGAAVTSTAYAAQCPSGNFCAWTDANFQGQRWNWSGDDGDWEPGIQDADSSWANHGVTAPGVKDHVQVYENKGWIGFGTVCLAPGQEIGYDKWGNDSGDSHTWTTGC